MRVLHVAPAFFPATYWGGPIYSTASLCKRLAERGVDVEVLTTDSAGPRLQDRLILDAAALPIHPGVRVTYCARVAGVSVAPSLLMRLHGSVKSADVVHLTGVYSFPTIPTLLACRLLQKPLVWSPRGALQKWSQSSATAAKTTWNWICRALAQDKLLSLHVTSQEELLESQSALPGISCALI